MNIFNQTYFWKNIQFKSQNQAIDVFEVHNHQSSHDERTTCIYNGPDGIEGAIIRESTDL
jgi:hypothetical protein